MDQFGAFVAGDAGGFLEVDLAVAADHADEMSVAVAVQDDGLVDTGDVLSELGGYGIGGEVFLVHFVWNQFVGDSGAVEQPGRVGLFGGFVLTHGNVFYRTAKIGILVVISKHTVTVGLCGRQENVGLMPGAVPKGRKWYVLTAGILNEILSGSEWIS